MASADSSQGSPDSAGGTGGELDGSSLEATRRSLGGMEQIVAAAVHLFRLGEAGTLTSGWRVEKRVLGLSLSCDPGH